MSLDDLPTFVLYDVCKQLDYTSFLRLRRVCSTVYREGKSIAGYCLPRNWPDLVPDEAHRFVTKQWNSEKYLSTYIGVAMLLQGTERVCKKCLGSRVEECTAYSSIICNKCLDSDVRIPVQDAVSHFGLTLCQASVLASSIDGCIGSRQLVDFEARK